MNALVKASSVIIENGPILATPEQFVISTQAIYSVTYPPFIKRHLGTCMHYAGIPTPQRTPEFFSNLRSLSEQLPSVLIINGAKDHIVSHPHINEFIASLRTGHRRVSVMHNPDGTHTRVYNMNIQSYQDAIEKQITAIL